MNNCEWYDLGLQLRYRTIKRRWTYWLLNSSFSFFRTFCAYNAISFIFRICIVALNEIGYKTDIEKLFSHFSIVLIIVMISSNHNVCLVTRNFTLLGIFEQTDQSLPYLHEQYMCLEEYLFLKAHMMFMQNMNNLVKLLGRANWSEF